MAISLSFLKKPKVLGVILAGTAVVVAIVYLLMRMGSISADTASSTYTMRGYLSEVVAGGGARSPGIVTVQNIAPQRILVGSSCATGTTSVTPLSATSDQGGNFYLKNIAPGCYTLKTTNSKGATETFSIKIPSNWTGKWITSVWGSNKTLFMSGLLQAPVTSPTPTSTATTYKISGTLKDANGVVISNALIRNAAPQYNRVLPGNQQCDTTQTTVTSSQATTDAAGKFTLQGLPSGCFTLKITKGQTSTFSALGSVAQAATSSNAINTSVYLVIPSGTTNLNKNIKDTNNTISIDMTISGGGGNTPTPTPTRTPARTPTQTPSQTSSTLDGTVYVMNNGRRVATNGEVQMLEGQPWSGSVWTPTTSIQGDGKYHFGFSNVNPSAPKSYNVRVKGIAGCSFIDSVSGATTDASPILKIARITPGANTMDLEVTCGTLRNSITISGEIYAGSKPTRPTSSGKISLYNSNNQLIQEVSDLASTNWKYEFNVSVPASTATYKVKATGFWLGAYKKCDDATGTVSVTSKDGGLTIPKDFNLYCHI